MFKSINSKGKVEGKKMLKCKSSNISNSHLEVTVPEAPKKTTCWKPTAFPGTKKYRSIVYKDLPKEVEVSLPQPCLGWKGGCAAKSTYEGSVVHLKRDGKRCGADNDGYFRCDSTLQGEFKFVNQKANCSRAKLVALKTGAMDWEESCRFAPAAEKSQSKDRVVCAQQDSKFAKMEVDISDNQPAAGRVGKVTLKFAPLSQVAMKLGTLSDKTAFKKDVTYQCTNGALSSLSSEKSSKAGDLLDRSWQHSCRTFPPGAGQLGAVVWPKSHNKFHAKFERECPKGEVLVGHKSEIDKKNKAADNKKDREFKFACRKLPAGMLVKEVGKWSAWTAWQDKWELKCATADEVMVGLSSEYAVSPNKDRRWKCKCATLAVRAPQSITFDVEFARLL